MKRRDKNIIIPYAIYTIITIILIVLSFTDFVKFGDGFILGIFISWAVYILSLNLYLIWIE